MTDPDEYSHAEYRRLFRGLQHQLTRMNSDWLDLWELARELRTQVDSLVEARQKDVEEIGKLRESLDAAREAFRELREEFRSLKNGGAK